MVDGCFGGVRGWVVCCVAYYFELRGEDWSEGGEEGVCQGGGGGGVDEEDLRWAGSRWRCDRGGEGGL